MRRDCRGPTASRPMAALHHHDEAEELHFWCVFQPVAESSALPSDRVLPIMHPPTIIRAIANRSPRDKERSKEYENKEVADPPPPVTVIVAGFPNSESPEGPGFPRSLAYGHQEIYLTLFSGASRCYPELRIRVLELAAWLDSFRLLSHSDPPHSYFHHRVTMPSLNS